ncbi:molybdopterin molybdotransferase MoeA [Arcobacter sp. FWKO B]|uniref:molybdopterin molybdotransferase MoeA n=1 Tax=Arcobacter sp. FWKO B TaxID=2593672 RepID=UPI0018A5697E|nr:molybdopterin molybdotransferase MoeA [Arcobacter sp. FWKO B]QOG11732.1 molybdopterin molybdotransferase MoeA [Arcobacter sp. FWKO B]
MALIPFDALEIIVKNTKVKTTQIVSLENSLGRVLANDIYANFSLPRFANSAMDGYAIIYGDNSDELKVIDKIFAGDDKTISLEIGLCVKIMTGARIPSECSAVVPQEDIEILKNGNIKLPKNIKKFQNIRFIGEDIRQDELLISKGEELDFSKISILSSMGMHHIEVFKNPKVIVFASGDELKQYYESIEPHQIYNSNTPTLVARVKELGCDVTFSKTSNDSLETLKNIIKDSLKSDFIITTGGVSVGEADFTKEAFNQLGFECLFDGIIIKPGKPTVFGKIGDTFILNLPGNPLAASLIFELFGKIVVQKLRGSKNINHNYILAKISTELKNKAGRVTLIPGFFDGEYFIPSSKTSPGMVSVLASCNSFIALDTDVEILNKDSLVKVLPINWNFISENNKDFLTK